MQACDCRSQNERMSSTAALAADTASLAFTGIFGVGVELPLGSRTNTSPSQNVIFNRKRMREPQVPAAYSAAWSESLAGRPEIAVRIALQFLSRFNASSA
jgi:hypothetical protein